LFVVVHQHLDVADVDAAAAAIQIVQQIGSDVDGSIVITIPATQTSTSNAVAAVDAPYWNPFLFAIHLLLTQMLVFWILHNLSPHIENTCSMCNPQVC
jgi:hypothetical protein